MNPEGWLDSYDESLKQLAANAAKTDKALKEIGGEATSQDGQVTVRVTASGATSDLVLRHGVRDMDHEHLARVILETTKAAQRDAGQAVVDVMQEFLGEDSDALEYVKTNLPEGYEAADAPPKPPELKRDTRPDDDYFENPPELIQ